MSKSGLDTSAVARAAARAASTTGEVPLTRVPLPARRSNPAGREQQVVGCYHGGAAQRQGVGEPPLGWQASPGLQGALTNQAHEP